MSAVYFVAIAFCFVCVTVRSECDKKEFNTCRQEATTLQCKNYIPKTIPQYVRTVYLDCLGNKRDINKETFARSGWSSIHSLHIDDFLQSGDLTFKNECFSGLPNLTEFHMKRGDQAPHVIMESNIFGGLRKLVTLDFRGLQVSHEALISFFNSRSSLMKLEELLISGYGIYQTVVMPLDDKLFDVLRLRPIRSLELSYMDVSDLNFTAFGEFIATSSLEYFNLSHTTLHSEMPKPVNNVSNVLKDLKVIDASGIVMPLLSMFCKLAITFSNKNGVQFAFDDGYATFSRADTLFINDFCPEGQYSNYIDFKNITRLSLVANFTWNLRNLYFNNNNLNVRIFDVELVCKSPSLELFSYTNNQLEYVNPKTFACIHTLKHLDLSGNKLYTMNNQTPRVFENLFTALYKLENVSLSNNKLDSIPHGMFANNTKLRRLDLSRNEFEQVRFNLSLLPNLELLDLSGNEISRLDKLSRTILDALLVGLFATPERSGITPLDLNGNPFSCRKCSDKESVKWVLSRKGNLKNFQDMTCTNEHHRSVSFRHNLIKHIQKICDRPIFIRNMIIVGSIGLVTVTLASILIVTLIRRRRRRKKREDKISLIHDGQDDNEFVAFISYSSDDHAVVNENVIGPLSEHLKQFVKTDRELISAGDIHFRPGHYIHNETFECLNRSSVALFVLTDNFTSSVHCMNEFEQAFEMKKPVALVTLGYVDTSRMSPAMLELYNRKARIIFAEEDGGFVLSTSWENVCQSIIDMME